MFSERKCDSHERWSGISYPSCQSTLILSNQSLFSITDLRIGYNIPEHFPEFAWIHLSYLREKLTVNKTINSFESFFAEVPAFYEGLNYSRVIPYLENSIYFEI